MNIHHRIDVIYLMLATSILLNVVLFVSHHQLRNLFDQVHQTAAALQTSQEQTKECVRIFDQEQALLHACQGAQP